MTKKGSVLMISLWILTILVVFALGLGHRAAINLRLAKYQRDRLKATCLAKAGINRAITEIINDKTQDYDSLKDNWVDNKEVFEKIVLNEEVGEENPVEFATVSYNTIDENKEPKTIYGVMDEERKININTASKELLQQLFILRGYEIDAGGLADVIIKWINSEKEEGKEIFKNGLLKAPEELLPILEYYYQEEKKEEKYQEKAQEVYNQIKDLITIYGDNKININTTSLDVLEVVITVVGADPNIQATPAEIQDLVSKIDNYRKGDVGYFTISDMNANEIKTKLGLGGEINNQTKIIDKLVSNQLLAVISENFRIEVTGNVSQIVKKITAIYDRSGEGKIVSWHEN